MKTCKIRSVKLAGLEKTYNVTMKSEQHNYVVYPNKNVSIVTSNSHSLAYAYISYQTAWLKRYYTREYFCALLSSVSGDHDKLRAYLHEARELGVRVFSIHINKSQKDFLLEADGIRPPLSVVKGVGDKAVDAIVASQPFRDFEDFVTRVDRSKVNVTVIRALSGKMASNAFRPLGVADGTDVVTHYEKMKKDLDSRKVKKDRFISCSLFSSKEIDTIYTKNNYGS